MDDTKNVFAKEKKYAAFYNDQRLSQRGLHHLQLVIDEISFLVYK